METFDIVVYKHVNGTWINKYDKLDAEAPESYNPAPSLFPE